jgi:hypothetical protein
VVDWCSLEVCGGSWVTCGRRNGRNCSCDVAFVIVTQPSTWSRHGEAQTVKLGGPFDFSQNGLDGATASLT